jgi:hypothetical protein
VYPRNISAPERFVHSGALSVDIDQFPVAFWEKLLYFVLPLCQFR